jgi:protein BUR2
MLKKEDVIYNVNDYYEISQEAQQYLRIGNSNIIQEFCTELKFGTEVAATSMAITHHFFVRKCYLFHDRYIVCASATLLASKLTSHNRTTDEFCSKLLNIRNRSISNIDHSKLEETKHQIFQCELKILETMNYDMNFDIPFQFIYYYADMLYPEQKKMARQTATIVCCDLYHTEICILYPARTMAIACLTMGAKLLGMPALHESNYNEDNWMNIKNSKLSMSYLQEDNPYIAMPVEEYKNLSWDKKVHPSISSHEIEEIIIALNEFHDRYEKLS